MDQEDDNHEDTPLVAAVRDAVETRQTEFKESQSFELLKWKLVKGCMAMANLNDGGRIIVGCDERSGVPEPSGMSEADQATYDQDALLAIVNLYARPPVRLTLRRFEFNNMRFVGITVSAFTRSPVMCTKDNLHEKPAKKQELKSGEIYARSLDRVATTRVVTPELLEEMLENAAWKRAAEIISNAQRAGLKMPESDKIIFDNDRSDFGWYTS